MSRLPVGSIKREATGRPFTTPPLPCVLRCKCNVAGQILSIQPLVMTRPISATLPPTTVDQIKTRLQVLPHHQITMDLAGRLAAELSTLHPLLPCIPRSPEIPRFRRSFLFNVPQLPASPILRFRYTPGTVGGHLLDSKEYGEPFSCPGSVPPGYSTPASSLGRLGGVYDRGSAASFGGGVPFCAKSPASTNSSRYLQ